MTAYQVTLLHSLEAEDSDDADFRAREIAHALQILTHQLTFVIKVERVVP